MLKDKVAANLEGKEDSKIVDLFAAARTSLKNKFSITASSTPTPTSQKKSSFFTFMDKKDKDKDETVPAPEKQPQIAKDGTVENVENPYIDSSDKQEQVTAVT